MERVVRERMTTQDVEAITPQTLINIRPVVAAHQGVLRDSASCRQFMDQTNPLAGLTHKRRLSALGPGWSLARARGVRGPRRAPEPLRPDVPDRDAGGPEHRPDRLPLHVRRASTGSGSSRRRTARSTGGKVTDKIEYLAADDEDRHVIAQANAPIDARRPLPRRPTVLVRRKGGEVDVVVARRGRLHGRLAEADRLGRDGADPVPRARRRQPRPDGRQHAAPGRPAAALRRAVHRHRRRGPRRRRRRRRGPRRGGRHRHRRLRRRSSSTPRADAAMHDVPALEVPPVQPGHLHQPEAAGRRGRQGRPQDQVIADGPSTDRASSRSARTSSSRSCRGRATTTRTRSSSPSAS